MKNRKMIIPAIIARRQKELDELLSKVEGYSELVQLDIMDEIFVPNNSLDFDFDVSDRNTSFEAHLMITDPMGWIEKNCWKVDTIIVHFESCEEPEDIIKTLKNKGKKIKLIIKPFQPTIITSLFLFLNVFYPESSIIFKQLPPLFYQTTILLSL